MSIKEVIKDLKVLILCGGKGERLHVRSATDRSRTKNVREDK